MGLSSPERERERERERAQMDVAQCRPEGPGELRDMYEVCNKEMRKLGFDPKT